MYSEDFRKKVIECRLRDNYSYDKLSKKFDVSIQFVSDLVNLYNRTGKYINEDLGKKSVDFKLSGKYETILLELIKKNPSMTLLEISIYFKENYDLSVGKSSVDRKLKSLGITVKKKQLQPEKRYSRVYKST